MTTILKLGGYALIILGVMLQYITLSSLDNLFQILFESDLPGQSGILRNMGVGGLKGLISAGLIIGGLGALIYARKLRIAKLTPSGEKDTRPPILYLRSFRDDAITSQPMYLAIPASWTAEEQLAEAIKDIGPFIAVGKPGERLPQLGAKRLYIQNDEWQTKVAVFMAEARLVILRAANTPGFWWELKRAVEMLPLHKLVLLIPFKRDKYEEFVQRVREEIGLELPPYHGSITPPSDLRGFVYFDLDGAAHFSPILNNSWFYNLKASIRKPLVVPLKYAFKPIFFNLEEKWREPKYHWGELALLSIGLFIGLSAIGDFIFDYWRKPEHPPSEIVELTKELRSVAGFDESFQGLTPLEARQKGRELAMKGLMRLPPKQLRNRAMIFSKILASTTVEKCARISEGTISPSAMLDSINALTPHDQKAWYDIARSAIIAELNNSPPPTKISETYQINTLEKLSALMPQDQYTHLMSILTGDGTRSDESLCWTYRTLFDAVDQLPPPDNDRLAWMLFAN